MADDKVTALDADARRTIARLASDTLPRLIERLARSELGELEVRDDGWRIRLRRPLNGFADLPAATTARERPRSAAATGHAAGPSDRPATASRGGQASRGDGDRGVVTSPAVGYFVPREGVGVGSKVARGDLVGHVDMLGVRQEVVAPVDGVLGAVNVESGQAIEYGQPIARVDTVVEPRAEVRVEA